MDLNIIKGCLLFPFLMGLLSCSSSVTTLVLQNDDPLHKPSQSNKVMVKYSLQANIQFSLAGEDNSSLSIDTINNETCEELLNNNPTIESCELDPYVKLVENDNLWGFQDTNIQEISNIESNENITIAVIDTGVDISHHALRNNIWINEDEIPGNGIDDDKNGYIDDIHGWDFANNDASVFDPGDGDTHGTHVAGIISSIIGDNPLRKIMVLKFINRQGGTISGAINAIQYAINNGAKLSNNSYGSYYYSSFFEEAIEFSRHHNHLLIAAAGNDARTDLFYPASFEQHNIISVAASNENHQLAYFSNRGIQHVDIAAPGNAIYRHTSRWTIWSYERHINGITFNCRNCRIGNVIILPIITQPIKRYPVRNIDTKKRIYRTS